LLDRLQIASSLMAERYPMMKSPLQMGKALLRWANSKTLLSYFLFPCLLGWTGSSSECWTSPDHLTGRHEEILQVLLSKSAFRKSITANLARGYSHCNWRYGTHQGVMVQLDKVTLACHWNVDGIGTCSCSCFCFSPLCCLYDLCTRHNCTYCNTCHINANLWSYLYSC
jgi:hypothetical protein